VTVGIPHFAAGADRPGLRTSANWLSFRRSRCALCATSLGEGGWGSVGSADDLPLAEGPKSLPLKGRWRRAQRQRRKESQFALALGIGKANQNHRTR